MLPAITFIKLLNYSTYKTENKSNLTILTVFWLLVRSTRVDVCSTRVDVCSIKVDKVA